jgi:hypothetical protein
MTMWSNGNSFNAGEGSQREAAIWQRLFNPIPDRF